MSDMRKETVMLGARLKTLIKKAGYSQKEFAALMGLTESRLSNYITGARQPDIFVLKDIADKLGVSMDLLCSADSKDAPIKEYVLSVHIHGDVTLSPYY